MPRGNGSVYRKPNSPNWYLDLRDANGKRIRISARTVKKGIANKLLRQRLVDVDRGMDVGPTADRLTVDDLFDLVIDHYRNNGNRTMRDLLSRLKRLRATFGAIKASRLTEGSIVRFKETLLAEGLTRATANRYLGIIRRAFRLGYEQRLVSRVPVIKLLRENNTRKGFFEKRELDDVLKALPAYMRDLVLFAYYTGWRKTECRTLGWTHIDLEAGIVRIEESKNDEPRTFPFDVFGELKELILRRRAATYRLERSLKRIIPWVFSHDDGSEIRDFARAWRDATKKAGYPGRRFHDLRRSAVRNLERAGVARSQAMKLTGHLTESVYVRYAIANEADLREAVTKLSVIHSASDGHTLDTLERKKGG